jgi:glycerophosphodiester phosphodiesterase|nr:MAG TPA: Glycerophosphoryl diester phosphodiesterase [Caudoviricetes sp.]
MASVFPVIGSWWGGNGARVGDGRLIRKGSSSTPFENAAYTVGERKWTAEITYTSVNSDTQIAMRANWFLANKQKTDKQDFITTWNIRAGSNAAVKFEFELPTNTYPLWTPSIAVPGTAQDITIHNFNVYETPKPGIEVVATQALLGVGGSMGLMSFPQARVDDVVVVFYASQFGNTAARPPIGWGSSYEKNISGRSGYVAIKRISNSTEANNVKLHGDTASTARERALCLLLRGVKDFHLNPWTAGSPVFKDQTQIHLVAAQYHGNNKTPIVPWQDPSEERHYSTGGASTTESWSSIEAGITKSVKTGTNAHGFAWVDLLPEVPEEEQKVVPGVAITEGKLNNPVFIYENGEERPATMKAVPRGYKDIGTMMITRGFLIAHRGGSVSWPEASMRAYTNAVMFGAGALEVSCQKTKDGVWFLNHDRTLQRVDKSAPDTPVTEMTWADVQKYHTIGEPFMTVEEYFAAYGSSHITVLDPKYSAAQWQELKKFFPTDAQGRIIWKFSIDAGWLAGQWKADGWKCWGYSYPDHVTDGRINEWHKPWDYIGMSWEASDEVWRRTTALGKPVWGHICPTRQAYDDALAKGAVGCMVSGVANIYSESLV